MEDLAASVEFKNPDRDCLFVCLLFYSKGCRGVSTLSSLMPVATHMVDGLEGKTHGAGKWYPNKYRL